MELLRGSAAKRNPTAVPTGQDMNALVVLEWDPITGNWHTVTQYPTNQAITP